MKQGKDMVRFIFWEDGLVWRTNGRGEAEAILLVRDAEMQPGTEPWDGEQWVDVRFI